MYFRITVYLKNIRLAETYIALMYMMYLYLVFTVLDSNYSVLVDGSFASHLQPGRFQYYFVALVTKWGTLS